MESAWPLLRRTRRCVVITGAAPSARRRSRPAGQGRETGATKNWKPLLRGACKWSEDAHHAAPVIAAVTVPRQRGYERRARCGTYEIASEERRLAKLCQSRLVSDFGERICCHNWSPRQIASFSTPRIDRRENRARARDCQSRRSSRRSSNRSEKAGARKSRRPYCHSRGEEELLPEARRTRARSRHEVMNSSAAISPRIPRGIRAFFERVLPNSGQINFRAFPRL